MGITLSKETKKGLSSFKPQKFTSENFSEWSVYFHLCAFLFSQDLYNEYVTFIIGKKGLPWWCSG